MRFLRFLPQGILPHYFERLLFTCERIYFDGLKVGTLRSGKKIASPVPGFRAFFGILCFTAKVPKPLNSILSFLLNALIIWLNDSFNTASTSDVVVLGTCESVSANRLSMTVEHDANTVLPTSNNFILFSKDNYANASGLPGYYARVCFKNNSSAKAELFGINADMFESSK